MQCNIDARGKAVRLVFGLIGLLASAFAAALAIAGVTPLEIGLVIALILAMGGAFGVFEGWKGWCALRAMGFRTPL